MWFFWGGGEVLVTCVSLYYQKKRRSTGVLVINKMNVALFGLDICVQYYDKSKSLL